MPDQPFPQRSYTPLCILGVPRCGSNLLSVILNNHPDILTHGEIFNENVRARITAPFWQKRPRVPYNFSPFREHLETHVFPADPEDKRVIGFKLFPPHLDVPPDGRQACINTLLSVPGLKIILLVRENLLDIALSTSIASRDNEWTHFDKKDPSIKHIHIKPPALLWRMEYVQQQYLQAESLVQGQSVYRLTYNDLVHNTDTIQRELQEFLGVPLRSLQPNCVIRKQRMAPRREVLLNFDAVRQECAQRHPEWVRFFDEPELLTEVAHHGTNSRYSIISRAKQSDMEVSTSNPAFYMQLFRDGPLANASIARIRSHYPSERIIVQSDGDPNPYYRELAEMFRCEYATGKRLYLVEHGGRMIQRMLNAYLKGPGDWLIKVDTDTRIDRRFINLPTGMAIYGSPLKQGPPQGGCVIIPRKVAQMLRDSRLFLSPLLKYPVTSWGAAMTPAFLRDRLETTGCIGFEWTLYWACTQLDIPIVRHPEIFSTWKYGNTNRGRGFAAVHPDKFINVPDKSVHDLCTVNHSGIHRIWLEAVAHSV